MEKENIFFVMAHPDDLVACLGLALTLKDSEKFRIHVADFTKGERGLVREGFSLEECARIRELEENKVCGALGVKQVYLGEIDGDAFACREVCECLAELFRKFPPRGIITHWPVDCHIDHVMCGATVLKAAKLSGTDPEIYFCSETTQTISMPIAHYFPFSEEILQQKAELIRNYKCQCGDSMAAREIGEDHYHGERCRYPAAEIYGTYQRPVPGKRCFFDEVKLTSEGIGW